MNRIILAITTITLTFFAVSCASTYSNQSSANQHSSEDVVAKIGEQAIHMDDLISYYERNNLESDYSSEDLREFLPYYVDFKLKLAYGEENGLKNDPELISEYENYSKQAAFSYWLENDIKKQMLEEYAERSQYELKAYHVLIRLEEQSSPARQEEALAKLQEARGKFVSGDMTIEEIDSEYSTRMSGRSAGGELPWFSAGVTVKPFEDALYSLEPGEISQPVRTQFGYHLIYLEEIRERLPDRKTSHIFFRGNRGDLSAEELSENAYEALENNRPWNEVVQEFTQDGASVNTGGEIGWIGYGQQYSAEFIDAVMTADTSKPYTEPVQTNYGYHIFKIDSVRTYESEEQRTAELLDELRELPRYKADRKLVLDRISKIGNLTIHDETTGQLQEFFTKADSLAIRDVTPGEQLGSQPLISFDGEQYRVNDFMDWLNDTNPDRKAGNFSDLWIDLYREYILDASVIELTRKEFPGFDNEIEGFLNGLIVFQVSDENIWNPETVDTTALRAYFEENRDRYRYDLRFDYTLIASSSDSILNIASEKVKEGEDPLEFGKEMERLAVMRDSVSAPVEEIMAAIEDLEPGELSESFRYRNRNSRAILNQVLEPRLMTFEEAFNRVNSDYQPIREELFMSELRDDYNVRKFPDRIRLQR